MGTKTTIKAQMLIGHRYQVIFTEESEELQTVADILSQRHKRLRVEYEDRRAFLAPFIPLLIDHKKKRGLKNVKSFSRMLHLLVDFGCARGENKTLDADCIADEIHKLYNELYPKK
ncbi:MAG: hypothetical protein LUE99_18335 [Bacteroides sp.]|nr:hypothetical protein [Bacteroides sp.]